MKAPADALCSDLTKAEEICAFSPSSAARQSETDPAQSDTAILAPIASDQERLNQTSQANATVVLGVDSVKDAVYARLKLTTPGPGFVHFPRSLDADYFRQLTAERVVTRFEKGRPIRSWRPKRDGEHNEALDTFVYAQGALYGLISMGLRLNEECHGTNAGLRLKGKASDDLQKIIPSPWLARANRQMQ
jgi:hypothetical protein